MSLIVVEVCFFFYQRSAYEVRISDWSSDVCSSDLAVWKSDKLRAEEIALDCVGKRHGGTRYFDDIHAGQQATEIGIEIFLIGKCLFMRKEDIFIRDCHDIIMKCPCGNGFRTEELRLGKKCVTTCTSQWSAAQ